MNLDTSSEDADVDSKPEIPPERHKKFTCHLGDSDFVPSDSQSSDRKPAETVENSSTLLLPFRPDVSDSDSESTLIEENLN